MGWEWEWDRGQLELQREMTRDYISKAVSNMQTQIYK